MADLIGFEEFIESCDSLAKALDGSQLAKAVKKGARIVQRSIQANAPENTGDLKGGLVLIKEKSRTKGKVVYQVVPTREKNAIFQKPIKNPVRSASKQAYYPASQEYGYFTRRPGGGMTYVRSDGSQATMSKVPGKYYMRTGTEMVSEQAKEAIAQGLIETITKEYGD